MSAAYGIAGEGRNGRNAHEYAVRHADTDRGTRGRGTRGTCRRRRRRRLSCLMRLLIVEDDPELAEVLTRGFGEHDMETVHAGTVTTARSHALLGHFDVIVLDVMLPGGTGFDLCRELRREGRATPILMLTARDTVDDSVQGLDEGADDYITKAFT